MAHMNVKAQVDQAGVFLSKVATEMNGFLNEATLSSMKRLNPEAEAYYCDILSTLRKLAVYSEDAAAVCRKISQQQTFPQQAAQQTLHRIYHQCIEEFLRRKRIHGMKTAVPRIQERAALFSTMKYPLI